MQNRFVWSRSPVLIYKECVRIGGSEFGFGHEPDFSQVVHDLTGARVDLKKGGVAAVRLDGSSAELIVVMRPRELDRIR